MATDTEKVTLGVGDLFLNGVNVGHLKGNVEFTFEVERVEFKPSDELGAVKEFKIKENSMLKAQNAVLKLSNLRLAMGMTPAQAPINASSSFPAYVGDGDSCSFSGHSGNSYDYMPFGGAKNTDEMCLRFQHTRPNGKTFHVIFYKAVSNTDFSLPFNEEEITMYDMTFKGLTDTTRTDGDKVGVLVEQVN